MLFLLFPSVSAVVDYIDTPSPSNDATDVDYTSTVQTCVNVDGLPQSCTMDLYLYEYSTGIWVEYQNHTGISEKGTYCGDLSVECGTTYHWKVGGYINCSGSTWWENHTYSFTTTDCPISHVSPVNGSSNHCPCCLAICAKFTNISGDTMKIVFQSNYSGSWQDLEDKRVVDANRTYCLCVPEFVWYNYTYYWRVGYADDTGTNYSDVFHFTTEEDIENCPCGESSGGCRGEVYNNDSFLGIIGIFGLLGVLSLIVRRKRI